MPLVHTTTTSRSGQVQSIAQPQRRQAGRQAHCRHMAARTKKLVAPSLQRPVWKKGDFTVGKAPKRRRPRESGFFAEETVWTPPPPPALPLLPCHTER